MMLNFDCRPSGLYEMDKKDFDPLAEQILLEKQPEVLKKAMPLDIDALTQDGFPLECHDAILSKDCSILGLITFMDKNLPIYDDEFHEISMATTTGTILIDKRLRNKPTRYRFTKAHELSHWILHRRFYSPIKRPYYFRNCRCSYVPNKQEADGRKNPIEAKTDYDLSEWQSDCLSAALLMPASTFIPTVELILKSNGITDMKIDKSVNDARSMSVVKEIASIYGVSERSVRIRLYTYGFYY